MKRRTKILVACLCVAIVLYLIVLPIPIRIVRSMPAVIMINDDKELTSAHISIEGWYHLYILKQDEFAGKFQIENSSVQFPEGGILHTIVNRASSPLTILTNDGYVNLGWINSTFMLNRIMLTLNLSDDLGNGYKVYAPATTDADITDILQAF